MNLTWWTKFWRRHDKPAHFLRIVVAPEWPDVWEAETVYVQGEHGREWFTAFVCPCGCRDIIYLNLLPESRPRWRLKCNSRGLPTIFPSVSREVRCRAHFIVRNGHVVMCTRNEDNPND